MTKSIIKKVKEHEYHGQTGDVSIAMIDYRCFFFSDSGYTDNDSYKMLIPTAWIPLLDSNEVNGCMEVETHLKLLTFT